MNCTSHMYGLNAFNYHRLKIDFNESCGKLMENLFFKYLVGVVGCCVWQRKDTCAVNVVMIEESEGLSQPMESPRWY